MTNLASNLNQLEASELVRRVRQEELAYVFKHALVQDTAQESLLKNDRKRLNLLVAQTLENLYAEHLDEFAARLFQHYDAAGDGERALQYAERAGDAAMRVSAYAEAIAAYQRAYELARRRADTSAQLIRLMTALGRAYELAPNYAAALALYQQTRDEGRARNDRALELAALAQMSKVLAVVAMHYDPAQAMSIAQEALQLARALNDQRSQARVLWVMLLMKLHRGIGAHQSVVYGEEALALTRALDWREQMAYTLNDLSYAYLMLGEMNKVDACAAEARALWRELDNKPMLTDNLNAAGMSLVLRGKYAAALEAGREARALSQTISNLWGETSSYMVEGYVHLERGELADALADFQNCMRLGDPIGVLGPTMMARFEVALIYSFCGAHERAEQMARDGLARTRAQAVNWNGWAYAVLAIVAAARNDADAFMQATADLGDAPSEYYYERVMPPGAVAITLVRARAAQIVQRWDDAQTLLDYALTRLGRSEYHLFVPVVLNELARLQLAQGQFDAAYATLRQADETARALELRAARLEIAMTQMELARARQDETARAAARACGRARVDEFLPLMSDELRASFLQTARARIFRDA